MVKSKKTWFRPLGCVLQLVGLPISFIAGLIAGVAAPVAAVLGIVAGVRLLTGKVPLPSPTGEGDERRLAFRLVGSEDAKPFLAEQWDRTRGEVKPVWDEIRATMKEGR